MDTDTTYELANRRAKAARLADALRLADADAASLLHLSDDGWASAAKVAGVGFPSPTTRDMVYGILLGVEREAAAAADPFASFPKF